MECYCEVIDAQAAEEFGIEIVFADSEEAAKILIAKKHGGTCCGVVVRRLPEFDKFSPGPVTDEALIDAGWWLSCFWCNDPVTQDGVENEDDDGDVSEFISPFYADGRVYCSNRCRSREQGYKRSRSHTKRHAIREFLALTGGVFAIKEVKCKEGDDGRRFGEVRFSFGDGHSKIGVFTADARRAKRFRVSSQAVVNEFIEAYAEARAMAGLYQDSGNPVG